MTVRCARTETNATLTPASARCCPALVGRPGAAASAVLGSPVAAPGTPSARPLQKGHIWFTARIPLGVDIWYSRSLLDLKGNLNSNPRFNGNPVPAEGIVVSARGAAWGPRRGRGQQQGREGQQDPSGSRLASGQLAGLLPYIPELSKNILLPHI